MLHLLLLHWLLLHWLLLHWLRRCRSVTQHVSLGRRALHVAGRLVRRLAAIHAVGISLELRLLGRAKQALLHVVPQAGPQQRRRPAGARHCVRLALLRRPLVLLSVILLG
jgi:hypothetical protein